LESRENKREQIRDREADCPCMGLRGAEGLNGAACHQNSTGRQQTVKKGPGQKKSPREEIAGSKQTWRRARENFTPLAGTSAQQKKYSRTE